MICITTFPNIPTHQIPWVKCPLELMQDRIKIDKQIICAVCIYITIPFQFQDILSNLNLEKQYSIWIQHKNFVTIFGVFVNIPAICKFITPQLFTKVRQTVNSIIKFQCNLVYKKMYTNKNRNGDDQRMLPLNLLSILYYPMIQIDRTTIVLQPK